MSLYVGCDVGTVSVKAAVLSDEATIVTAMETGSDWRRLTHSSPLLDGWHVFLSPYLRAKGDPLQTALDLLARLRAEIRDLQWSGVCATGSGGRLLSNQLRIPYENEFRALSRGVGILYPGVSQLFEIGGETAKYLSVQVDPGSGTVGIADFETNGDCAAGTGSFLDQQASRLRYRVEEVGRIALSSDRASQIAGRCSVFAKSDMIHAQQKGAMPPEVLRGLCQAVARNFRANVVKGRKVGSKVAFVGGVAQNRGVEQAVRDVFELDGTLFTPEEPAFYGAVGAALLLKEEAKKQSRIAADLLTLNRRSAPQFPSHDRLDLENVLLLRNRTKPYEMPKDAVKVDAYLGVDVGSVSTNLVCVDPEGNLIHDIYLRTKGRPIEVVGAGLKEIEDLFGDRIVIRGVATTGSGRELIGELIGADAIHDEITAHKTGAFQIAQSYLGTTVDTIFEIGGQDSKYIHLREGVVVEFAMNEACAAGTGSFLEEQAEQLGVNIVDEFSRLALQSGQPVRLGERCTVFMERDVARYQHQGADREALIAGLAYAVVYNYLNRVVRGRPIGDVIFFQGGTAYNDSVAAAFAKVLGKRIIVPPYNGVLGAYGAALLAKEKVLALRHGTSFRGFRIEDVSHKVRVFTCQGCSNNCDIQEFTVGGKKTYWGDKCAEKYRKEAKVPREPVVPDLFELREVALTEDYLGRFLSGAEGTEPRAEAERVQRWRDRAEAGRTVGIPRSMYLLDQLPFWSTYLRALGFELRLSGPTTKTLARSGVEATVAEPCYPVQVAHGHVAALLGEPLDHVLIPNVINAEADGSGGPAYTCPWGQTLPWVTAASPLGPALEGRLLAPTVHFREGARRVEAELWRAMGRFGSSRPHHRSAVSLAFRAQTAFRRRLLEAGKEALKKLAGSRQAAIVLVGRPYNVYDKGVNLNIPHKLRSSYGVNVIPLDFLPLDDVSISDINSNMFWNYGRKILQAGRFTSLNSQLHLLYLTNFKCGPDSYVKQFCEDAAVKPFLVLQFDGHGSDAGMMTRCEAYLDSKGILRWWREAQTERFKERPSTCPACATEPPGSGLQVSGA